LRGRDQRDKEISAVREGDDDGFETQGTRKKKEANKKKSWVQRGEIQDPARGGGRTERRAQITRGPRQTSVGLKNAILKHNRNPTLPWWFQRRMKPSVTWETGGEGRLSQDQGETGKKTITKGRTDKPVI